VTAGKINKCSKPWREDVVFGAVQEGDALGISLFAEKQWEGKILFDVPCHKMNMKMPLDWPRINQFPEWFTVESEKHYTIHDVTSNSKATYAGQELHEGIGIDIQVGKKKHLVVKRSD